MRALLLSMVLAASASAQDGPQPDTTDWHRYLPLDIGNAWEYEVETPIEPGIPIYTLSFHKYEITGDSLVGGVRYFNVEFCQKPEHGTTACSDSGTLVRYDEQAATVVQRNAMGDTAPWVALRLPCSLDLGFPGEAVARCADGFEEHWWMDGLYGEPVCFGSSCVEDTWKSFNSLVSSDGFFAGIGRMYSSMKDAGGSSLRYARIGTMEYGTTVVETEALVPGRSSGVRVAPNPVRGTTTLRFVLDSSQDITLEVFSVLGRRVRTEYLGGLGVGEQVVRFEPGELPSGAYRLRLTGSNGFAATRGVILHR